MSINHHSSQLYLLKALASCKDKYRKAILKNGDRILIQDICECAYNLLKGNLEIDPKSLDELYKYRRILRKLCEKSTLKQKRKILVQKGGFLRYILPFAIATISSLIKK